MQKKFRNLGIVLVLCVLALPIIAKGSVENNPSNSLIFIVNYPYQIWSDDFTKIHLTLFKPDFQPAKGAVVKVNDKEVGKTDANGICVFDYKPGNSSGHVITAVLNDNGKTYKIQKAFSSNSRTESFKANMLYVYTDRGVYNPGQEILVRLIAWQLKKEYFPVAAAEVQLMLQDKNGKIFSGEKLTTNDFGIAATRLPLAPNMPEGDYELVVLYEETRETAELRVQRFIPPVINIKHDLKRYLTDSQTEWKTNVTLEYFTGAKMETAQLSLQVIQDEKVLFSKELPSQAPVFAVTLYRQELESIRAQLAQEQWFKVKLSAKDSYGQSDELQWDMLYTARPFTTVLEIDKDAYPAGESVQVLAKIVDIDGQPATNMEVSLEVMETSMKYSGKTDNKGTAVLSFKMPEYAVTVVVKSPQVSQPLAERSIPYQEKKPMLSKVNDKPGTAGTVVTMGVTFDNNYIPVEKVVHIDLTDISGALVDSTTIPVYKEGGGYVARGDITGPTWGSMLVNLYCCAIERKNEGKALSPQIVGFITEGQHVTFYADKNLEIKVTGLGASVRPGEAATFQVTVTGGTGEKCLGVSVVDSAVLSLLNPFIRNPEQHFYNPQAKVISTGGAGVLTWPVVDRNWGQPMRDIAYSDWGWKSPGSMEQSIDYGDNTDGAGVMEYKMMDSEDTKKDMAPAPPSPMTMQEKELSKPDSSSAEMALNSFDGKNGDRRADGDGTQAAEQPQIVIRTEFPETTLWEPLLVTEKGKANINLTFPDSITTQKLSILATDKDGYLSLLQQDITVTQPLFVRSLLPAGITLGDDVEVSAIVQNTGDKEAKGSVVLAAPGLKITGGKKDIAIPARGSKLVSWNVSASRTGEQVYTVTLNAGGFTDAEEKKLMVLPSGIPQVTRLDGKALKNSPFNHTFINNPQASYVTANVNVSLPGVLPAFQALLAFDTYFYVSPWTAAAIVIMDTAMQEYALAAKLEGEFTDFLAAAIKKAVAVMVSSQQVSGGWGWYLNEPNAPNLYLTLSCLRALAEARNAGYEVADSALTGAMDYILKNMNSKGLWSSKGAYFWEFFNDDTDNSLSAEIFEVLMQALLSLEDTSPYRQQLASVKSKIAAILEKGSTEPTTIAAGLMGMIYYNRLQGDNAANNTVNTGLQALLTLKRTGYWEPHWYHAYGGMVELNARIVELLALVNYKEYEAVIREVGTWLLATRTSWGAWHNEIGTANAVRALLKIAAKTGSMGREETASDIGILVNDKQAINIKIDPADPFLSAARLKFFEITPWLIPGANKVSVVYTGNLEAAVTFELNEWGAYTGAELNAVTIKRQVPGAASMGQPITVTIDIEKNQAIPMLLIEESIPSNAAPDKKSLDTLVAQGSITNYTLDGQRLSFTVAGEQKNIQIKYKLGAIMKGTAHHPGLTVLDAGTGEILGSVVSTDFVVK